LRYRTREGIVADLLTAAMHSDDGGGVGIATIIRKGNVSYARAAEMLGNLVRAGLLLEEDGGYAVTPDGLRYLEAYRDFEGFARSFGLRL
jgi:predicted transcriptional regulator